MQLVTFLAKYIYMGIFNVYNVFPSFSVYKQLQIVESCILIRQMIIHSCSSLIKNRL